ncbi:hypothetical protein M011DRAFT_412238, partial [Sporormia fimetaria CBS 119925]
PDPSYANATLTQRSKRHPSAQRTANLIFHTLKSYAIMLHRDNSLPPFIHPRTVSEGYDAEQVKLLTNCISLIRMLNTGTGTRKLFWKNVRLEFERVIAEYRLFSRWQIIAAMQALSLYVLIRLHEGETEHNNVDYVLQQAVFAVASYIASMGMICDVQSPNCIYGPQISWNDWIFEESARRIGIIYRIVAFVTNLDLSGLCPMSGDLLLSPLPARKTLWEAMTEETWDKESQRDNLHIIYGLAKNGDLVRVGGEFEEFHYCLDAILSVQGPSAEKPWREKRDWEEWCAGMDGLGGLVLFAASLTAEQGLGIPSLASRVS